MANFVNVLPSMVTVYRQLDMDEVEQDSEVLMIAKIRTADATTVIEYVTANSPTDVAEIYTLPVGANRTVEYLHND